MRKVLLATAFVFMSGNAFAETSEYTCPEGSASTLHCFTCGSNCTMTLDTSTGHAVVEGTGDMEGVVGPKFKGGNPWNMYNSELRTVEIKEGITSIGTGAFKGSNVVDIIIPNSVVEIGDRAFCDAYILPNITIPDSVKKIGEWAFDRTYALKEIVIPDSVQEIGYGVFYQSGIHTLTIPDTLAFESLCLGPDIECANSGQTFVSVSLQNVICAGGGDTAKCDALLKQVGRNIQSVSRPNYKKDENGNIVERYVYDADGNRTSYILDGRVNKYDEEGNLVSYTKSNADGSVYTYDADGNVKSIRGKKIYTVEEAEAVTAHGDRFHVSLTYK